MTMTTNDILTELNYRLADVLVYIKGYKAGIEANPQGNAKARQANIELCNWVETNLLDSKRTIAREIDKD
jgi:hypothetical protein